MSDFSLGTLFGMVCWTPFGLYIGICIGRAWTVKLNERSE